MSNNWPDPSDNESKPRRPVKRLPVLWEVTIVTTIILIAVIVLWKMAYPASGH